MTTDRRFDPDLAFFDFSAIQAAHATIITKDPHRSAHRAINCALDLLFTLLDSTDPPGYAQDWRSLRLIGLRLFNTSGAVLELARCGLFVQAFTLARDVVEIEFLLDLFCRFPEELTKWVELDENNARKRFAPVEVRKRLDEADGFQEKKRAQIHGVLSNHAAHVSPQSVRLLQREKGDTPLGPFSDSRLYQGVLEELAIHVIIAVEHFRQQPLAQPVTTPTALLGFIDHSISWLRERMAAHHPVDLADRA